MASPSQTRAVPFPTIDPGTILGPVKWLLSAFLGVFALVGSPAQAQECATKLEVATLNTWGLPAPLSKRRHKRFAAIEDYLRSDLDIIGLQEVWRTARSLLPFHLRLPSAGDSGLAVATPYPSTRPVLTPFTRARGFDGLKRKGAISTTIGLPDDHRLNVVVTHMQAGHTKAAARVRAEQIRQVLEVADAQTGPVLVMGDFNLYDDLDDDVSSSRLLERAGYADGTAAAGPTYRTGDHRLDRIYVRGGTVLASDVPQTDLSDHLPVEATVAICP